MYSDNKLLALAILIATNSANAAYVEEPPFPTPALANTAPIGTGTGLPGTGIGTIIPTVTGTGSIPASTGTPPVKPLPRAGQVYFLNQCPFPLYITTNLTTVQKPAVLDAYFDAEPGAFAYEFELLNPAETHRPGPAPTSLPVSSAVATVSGAPSGVPTLEPRRVSRGWHGRDHRGHQGARHSHVRHSHQWNATADLGVEIQVGRAGDDGVGEGTRNGEKQEGRIAYYAHEGVYDYRMDAPKGFMEGLKSTVEPAGKKCKTTEGWEGDHASCEWTADMWVTFCVGFDEDETPKKEE